MDCLPFSGIPNVLQIFGQGVLFEAGSLTSHWSRFLTEYPCLALATILLERYRLLIKKLHHPECPPERGV